MTEETQSHKTVPDKTPNLVYKCNYFSKVLAF